MHSARSLAKLPVISTLTYFIDSRSFHLSVFALGYDETLSYGIWESPGWDMGDPRVTMVAQRAHWLCSSPVLTRLPGSNRELGS